MKKVVDTARDLEGLKRQWGVHAAGVILSREPLLDVIPIQRREQDGAIITQFDMGACEALGLLKMDFLGLRNLTVLDDCLAGIKDNRGDDVVLETSTSTTTERPTSCSAAATRSGSSSSTAAPMRSLLRSMRPTSFADISAVGALYRPGPDGRQRAQRLRRPQERPQAGRADPSRARRAARRDPRRDLRPDRLPGAGHGDRAEGRRLLARPGRPAAPRDGQEEEGDPRQGVRALLRRACASAATARGAIKTLWDTLVPFSDYAFNKAHSAGYGVVSYWTAYLKANYPAEYMAALLTSVKDDKDKSALYLHECRRMGIKVLPPDVNESDSNFTPRGTDIRFGLSAIRNVGENVVASIIDTRRAQGPRSRTSPTSWRKVEPVVCNKKVVESLIKAGAFDSLGHTRRGLLAVHADVDRRGDGHQARRGGRPVRPVRLGDDADGEPRGLGVRRRDPVGGVGQDRPARRRARHARPLRLRPSAVRHRARAVAARRLLDQLADGRRAARRQRSSRSAASSPACSAR